MILLPPDGPSPHPHAPAFLTPHPGPPLPTPPAAQNAVISPEDDIQRLFNVCKVGRGNAELLNEVLVYAKPQDLRNEITKVTSLSRPSISRPRARHRRPDAGTFGARPQVV